ncbi:MAG: hypothetical protein U1E39_01905 [Planctomycetota bacterium]
MRSPVARSTTKSSSLPAANARPWASSRTTRRGPLGPKAGPVPTPPPEHNVRAPVVGSMRTSVPAA